MPAKRKDLGNYEEKISNYFKENKNTPNNLSKTSLNLTLGIDRKYIYDCRQRQAKWQQDFLLEYDKACRKIANKHLRSVLKLPQYQWQYLRTCHPEEFDDLVKDKEEDIDKSSINIILENIRVTSDE